MPELSKEVSSSSGNEAIYLCNFRVSVDGDWLCLKELQDTASSTFPNTPEFDHILNYYPDYPVVGGRENAATLSSRIYIPTSAPIIAVP